MKRIIESLFPGNQLKTLLEMVGVLVFIISYAVLRAKIWQRHGGSAVFLSKQRFQTLFGKREEDVNDRRS